MSMKDNKYLYFGYLLVIGIVFYLMNVFTPLCVDDWHYNFIYGTDTPIKTIGDVLYSQYLHYFSMNGRFVPHFFVQIFDGILGKQLFNVVNTIVFLLFLHLLCVYVSKGRDIRFSILSISVFLVFIVLGGFNEEYLWMSGACNYLWCGTILLLFDYCFLHEKLLDKISFFIIVPFGVLCGWTNEAMVIGMSAGYLYIIYRNKFRLNRQRCLLLLGLFIGAAFLVLSPGSFHRFEHSNEGTISLMGLVHSYIQSFINMRNIRMLPLLLFVCSLGYLLDKEKVKHFINENSFWLLSITISFVFVAFTKQGSLRSRFGIEFFSLLLLLKYFSDIRIKNKWLYVVNAFVLIITSSSLLYKYRYYQEYKNVLLQIKAHNEIIITEEPEIPSYARRYIVYYIEPETSDLHFAYSINNSENKAISKHFGVESLVFIPKRLYAELHNNPNRYNDFSCYPDLPYYVKRTDRDEIKNIHFVLNETDYSKLPFYIRPFARRLSRYSATKVEANKYHDIVHIDDVSYIFVNRHLMIDNRLKEIVVE